MRMRFWEKQSEGHIKIMSQCNDKVLKVGFYLSAQDIISCLICDLDSFYEIYPPTLISGCCNILGSEYLQVLILWSI